jgi:hypothetical protein
MLGQVLQRDAVLQQLERVKSELSRPADSRRRVAGPALPSVAIDGKQIELTEEDLRIAAKELAEAEKNEKDKSSGQPGFEPVANRRGDTAKPLDDVVFLSREPAIGLLQSALEQYHLDEKPESITTSVRRAAGEWEPVSQRRLLNEFSETDPGWVASVVAMGLKLFHKPHPFKKQPAEFKIGNRARILVVGDWGSGIERAQGIAAMMREIIEEGRHQEKEQHVMHLGDVYYSGWGWEVDLRFLAYWPVKKEEANSISSWSLNGNHDMYSGGYGYFDRVLGDSRFERQQKASYFRLYNDYWQLLGLDTAHQNNVLRAPQSEWVREQTKNSQKTILLSHHQPFTVYDEESLEMDKNLNAVLRDRGIRGWFFGHEHRCIVYSEYLKIRYPRLIGHGGVPVYMTHREEDPVDPPVAYEYRKYISGGIAGIEHWAPFGFAILDLDGPKIGARYFYEDGFTYPAKNKEPDVIE